jgi:hypothetical protein
MTPHARRGLPRTSIEGNIQFATWTLLRLVNVLVTSRKKSIFKFQFAQLYEWSNWRTAVRSYREVVNVFIASHTHAARGSGVMRLLCYTTFSIQWAQWRYAFTWECKQIQFRNAVFLQNTRRLSNRPSPEHFNILYIGLFHCVESWFCSQVRNNHEFKKENIERLCNRCPAWRVLFLFDILSFRPLKVIRSFGGTCLRMCKSRSKYKARYNIM